MVYRYVGNGRFLYDIPARDLDAGDVARLSNAQKKNLLVSNLYEKVPDENETHQENGSQKEKSRKTAKQAAKNEVN